ncbi:FkbM family methyltransferase [Sphingomonas natans]|uniref:FkbM family methyltransferase n=1 Tax=Sphingomonas natans TaxID=3063330 RepID=UPI0026E43528|nr:FkbM family methyltransferase [Sphingomonas sp. BIUV-7]
MRAERRLQRLHDIVARLDHISLGSSATYVGNNRVLLRIIAGVHIFILYVHADDKLISPWLIAEGRYEPDLTSFFVREIKPDSHCIDVGANLGYFTCLMAKYALDGKVIALEPNPFVHALAADNILINALHERSAVWNVAASDREGELTLFHRVGRAGNTSVAACGDEFTREMREPPEEAFQVSMIRIDGLLDHLSGRVDFMKIDVEGAEPLALAGARATITANPQLQIVMEWAPDQIRLAGFDIAAFVRDISAMGLEPFVLSSGVPQRVSNDDLIGLGYQQGVLLRRI